MLFLFLQAARMPATAAQPPVPAYNMLFLSCRLQECRLLLLSVLFLPNMLFLFLQAARMPATVAQPPVPA
jgi:hypothetical protein